MKQHFHSKLYHHRNCNHFSHSSVMVLKKNPKQNIVTNITRLLMVIFIVIIIIITIIIIIAYIFFYYYYV